MARDSSIQCVAPLSASTQLLVEMCAERRCQTWACCSAQSERAGGRLEAKPFIGTAEDHDVFDVLRAFERSIYYPITVVRSTASSSLDDTGSGNHCLVCQSLRFLLRLRRAVLSMPLICIDLQDYPAFDRAVADH